MSQVRGETASGLPSSHAPHARAKRPCPGFMVESGGGHALAVVTRCHEVCPTETPDGGVQPPKDPTFGQFREDTGTVRIPGPCVPTMNVPILVVPSLL